MRRAYVYILANRSRTLYTGVTSDLEPRIRRHKSKADPDCFTARYNITRLVFYEEFPSTGQAIEWEKRIKGWTRAKKVALIEERNPYWKDLAAEWEEQSGNLSNSPTPDASAPAAQGTRDPSLRSG